MSLLELLTKTKGIEYLIAIGFLFVFIAVWLFVHYRGKNLLIRIVPVLVVGLGFGGLAYSCEANPAAAVTVDFTGQAPLRAAPVIANTYGPALFDHKLHQSAVNDCYVCHHNSGKNIQPCNSCHNDTASSGDPNKPGIAHIFHLRCIGCHSEKQASIPKFPESLCPTDCRGCHPNEQVPPPSIPHGVSGNENCLACHGGGLTGMPQIPQDHAGTVNLDCQLCHIGGVK